MVIALDEIRRGTSEIGSMSKGFRVRRQKGGMEDRMNAPGRRKGEFESHRSNLRRNGERAMTTRGKFSSGIGGSKVFPFKINKVANLVRKRGRVVLPLARGKGLSMFNLIAEVLKLQE